MLDLRKGMIYSALALMVLLSGCGNKDAASGAGDQAGGQAAEKPKIEVKEPVTVKLAVAPNYLDENQVKQFISDPVSKKYPNITIQILPFAPNLKSLQDLVAQGELPDLLITSSNIMDPMRTVGFATNIEPDLKAGQLDLSRIDQGSLKAVRMSSGGEYLSAVPYSSNFSALYYNKDILDKFGVPYPKDDMTWDDATDLAKKLTRQDGGVQYRGLHPDFIHRPASQLGLGFVDPKTQKAIVNNEKWKKVFEMEQKIFSIPGNPYAPGGSALNMFSKDKTLAMFATINQMDKLAAVTDLKWDMAGYPTFPETKGRGINYDLHVMAITANSKHKDAATLVISVLVSDEVQADISRNGRISVLNNESINKQFGQNLTYLQGKHVEAIFKVKPADNFAPTEYDGTARGIVNDAISSMVFKDNVDINTALRKADEEINQLIETGSSK
ncbi:MAG: family 1 extracellular solute-binding protein [Paenibacillaceae bacterium]|nr:family 1 extracellular solute-binding protein [Paenibacillaceae bacterium]